MTKQSYTEALNELREIIERTVAVDPKTVALMLSNQEEIKEQLAKLNGTVRTNCLDIGRLQQWSDDHISAYEKLDDRVSRWIVGNLSIAAVLTAVGTAVSFLAEQIKAAISSP